jgi:predicted cupin superfamily sugar epimerase
VLEISPEGVVKRTTLGHDLAAGQQLQVRRCGLAAHVCACWTDETRCAHKTVQHVVPGGHWFGSFLASDAATRDAGCVHVLARDSVTLHARLAWLLMRLCCALCARRAPAPPADAALNYALVGCTVAPGFDFADFEMAECGALLAQFPHAADDITFLTTAA